MSVEQGLGTITLIAAADLSGKQYYGIKIDSAGKAALATEGSDAIGILQNDPASGGAACVAVRGISKVVGGASVARGLRFSFDSTGKAVSVGSGDDWSMGVILEALVSGKISTVLLNVSGPTV